MFKVPSSLKTVFDTFPLVRYPPVANTTPASKEAVEHNRHYFGGASSPDSFILGVHHCITVDEKVIPSDPISLAHALVLCHKNGLTLPRPGSSGSHSILKVSHKASPDRQLPVLIETDADTSRRIKLHHFVSEQIHNSLEPQHKLIDLLVSHQVYDSWVLALLVEGSTDPTIIQKVFGIDSGSPAWDRLRVLELLQEVTHWNSFRARHPYLFNTKRGDFLKHFRADSPALRAYYNDQLDRLEELLPTLVDLDPVVELKLAAFSVSVHETLGSTRLAAVVPKSGYDVVARY